MSDGVPARHRVFYCACRPGCRGRSKYRGRRRQFGEEAIEKHRRFEFLPERLLIELAHENVRDDKGVSQRGSDQPFGHGVRSEAHGFLWV
jgi:hypothetical protein